MDFPIEQKYMYDVNVHYSKEAGAVPFRTVRVAGRNKVPVPEKKFEESLGRKFNLIFFLSIRKYSNVS